MRILYNYHSRSPLLSLAWLALQLIVMLSCNSNSNSVEGWTPPISLLDRRSCLQLLQLLQVMDLPTSSTTTSNTNTNNNINSMPKAPAITDKIFMDIRVARQDGSTYVRDDLPDTFDNNVLTIRLVLGLYGKLVPNHVQKFLSYIETPKDIDVDNPFPSYSRSNFPSLDQTTGLLQGGNIASLRVKDIGGTTAITYGQRVLPANFWMDKSTEDKVLHSTKGLLTHKTLDVTPKFGITTRAAPELDATHTVFGEVLFDSKETVEFFSKLQDLPTYSVEQRPSGYGNEEYNPGGVVSSVFNAQREIFRGAAKSLGDTRVDKVYEGKLLRRVEVMRVGRL